MSRANGGGRRHPTRLFKVLALLAVCCPTLAAAVAGKACSVHLEGQRDGSTRVSVACAGEILLDEVMQKPKETPVPGTPLILFESAPNITSFLRISKEAGDEAFYLKDSQFVDLIGTESSVAPLVVDEMRVRISNSDFKRNSGFKHGAISMATAAPVEKTASLLSISDCTFVDNSNGAINVAFVPGVAVAGSTFVDNQGPAVLSQNVPELTIDTSNFTQNVKLEQRSTAVEGGGEGNLFVSYCTFTNHLSQQSGGAVSWTAGGKTPNEITLSRCHFYRNVAVISGGAVSVEGKASLQIEESEFGSNELMGESGTGGAVSVSDAVSVSVTSSNFHDHGVSGIVASSVDEAGSSFDLETTEMGSVSRKLLQANGKTVASGGALAVTGTKSVAIKDSHFSDNCARFYGGALSVSQTERLEINGSTFVKNSALYSGGGLSVQNTDFATGYGNSVTDNTAGMGGGMHIANVKKSVVLDSGAFERNVADESSGGAISIEGSPNVSVRGLLLDHNKADNVGGGIALSLDKEKEANFLISRTTCKACTASTAMCIHINGSGKGNAHVAFLHQLSFSVAPNNRRTRTTVTVQNMGNVNVSHSVFDWYRNTSPHLEVKNAETVGLTNVTLKKSSNHFACKLSNVKKAVHVSGSRFTDNMRGGLCIEDSGNISISHSKFDSNGDTHDGGMVLDNVGMVSLFGASFIANGNKGQNGGGALIRKAGSVVVRNSMWSSNTGRNGGGLYLMESGNVELANCTWKSNWANWGGAVYMDQVGAVDISQSTFFQNFLKAAGVLNHQPAGGAVWLNASSGEDFSFWDNAVERCSAWGGAGGGIWVEGADGSVNVTNSRFEGCLAKEGGAIKATGRQLNDAFTNLDATFTIHDSEFIDNKADDGGGSISIDNTEKVAISNSSVMDSTAGAHGGGISLVSVQEFTLLLDIKFSANKADGKGGSLYIDGANRVDIANGSFQKSTAGSHGGAIYMTNVKESTTLVDVQFMDNSAESGSGGGVRTESSPSMTLQNAVFDGNSAGQKGGGASVALSENPEGTSGQPALRILHSNFTNNFARRGGAFTFKGLGKVELVADSFDDGSAERGGVASLDGEIDAFATDSYFGFNEAKKGYQMFLCGVHLKLERCHIVVQYLAPDVPTKIGKKAFLKMSECAASEVEEVANTVEPLKIGEVWTFLGLRRLQLTWVVVGTAFILLLCIATILFAVVRRSRRRASRKRMEESLVPGGPLDVEQTTAPPELV